MSERKEEVVARIGRKRNQQQKENVMSEQAVVEGEVGPSAPLTGSNDARSAALDELGRSIDKAHDLNTVKELADTFDWGVDEYGKPWSQRARLRMAHEELLKFPVKAKGGMYPEPMAQGLWQIDGAKRPNPMVFDPDGNEMYDNITPTFFICGTQVDHDTPPHYQGGRGEGRGPGDALARRMSYGHMRGKPAILLESYFESTIPEKELHSGTASDGTAFTRTVVVQKDIKWWAATAILYPTGDVEAWYEQVVMNMLCLPSFDDYVPTEDEERATVDQVAHKAQIKQRFASMY